MILTHDKGLQHSRRILLWRGNDDLSVGVARCLGEVPGLELHPVSSVDHDFPLRHSRHIRKIHSQPAGLGDQALLNWATDLCRRNRIDLLLPVQEPEIRWASQHRETLSSVVRLPALPATAEFDVAVDKWLLADRMQRRGISCPATALLEDRAAVREIPPPFLLKPRRGTGGARIQKLASLRDLDQATRGLAGQDWIVQHCCSGFDIDCSVLCRDGKVLAHTIQRNAGPPIPAFQPSQHLQFCPDATEVLATAAAILRDLHWDGVAHLDLRFDTSDGRVKVIEINGRYWGTLVGSLLAGVNFPWMACRDVDGHARLESKYAPIQCRLGHDALAHRLRHWWSFNDPVRTDLPQMLRDPGVEWFRLIRRMKIFLRGAAPAKVDSGSPAWHPQLAK